MRPNDELIDDELVADPGFRAEWKRTAPARAVATALVRYRADQNLSQRELADRLRMNLSEVAGLELGDDGPSTDTLRRISDELGIDLAVDIEPSPGDTRTRAEN